MKRFLNYFLLTSILALVATSCYQEEIDNLQKQIDELTGSTIATIDSQIKNINASITDLQSVENSLSGYITSLQSDNSKIKGQIEDLTAVDKNLSVKIGELKSFVNGELKSSKDWANATFATLAQYDSLATVVAGIPAKIDAISKALGDAKTEITANYEKAIKNAVEASEASMKSWVNEKLTDYYTIAQLNATLDSLGQAQSAVDSTINAKIDEQKVALDTAKSQITSAYQAAIKTAVDSLEGKINTKLAQDIATAKNALQTQITSINTEITNIKSRLDAAEANINALIAQIQSIVVVPQYNDGSVGYIDGTFDTISFNIKPTSAAQALATAWKIANNENRAKMVSFNIQEVLTKGQAVASATVDTVFFKDDEFKVGVKFENLPANAMTSLHIASGASDIASKFFSVSTIPGCLYFTVIEGSGNISLVKTGTVAGYNGMEYSLNGLQWQVCSGDSVAVTDLSVGSKVYFKALDNNPNITLGQYLGDLETPLYVQFKCSEGMKVNVSGNIMRLLHKYDPSNVAKDTVLNDTNQKCVFYRLFSSMPIVDASELVLPAKQLSTYCYCQMFEKNTFLVKTPSLHATTLAYGCYSAMFHTCTALATAPDLPSTSLAENCYASMFSKCTSLVNAPSLPATTLAKECYTAMFGKCTSLVTAPSLGVTTLEERCYRGMFKECSSLISAPELPATTLVTQCYDEMFNGCTKLSSVKMLATDVSADKCLRDWLMNAGTDESVTSRTVTINASLNPNDTTGAVKTIKEKSAGWDITNGTKAVYAYESYGYGIDIDGVVWAPVNCGYHATNYTYGKLYQWGRKDGCGYNDNATYTETVIQTATAGPVAASSEDASKFYTVDESPKDWLNPQDSTRWNGNTGPDKETSPTKTNYDPCPTGWRVPTEAEFRILMKHKSEWTSKDSQNGFWFSGSKEYSDSAPRVFLPAAGSRDFEGTFDLRNSAGYYWSSSPYGVEKAKYLYYFMYEGSLINFNISVDPRANGFSVRCVKDSGQPQ